MIVDVGIPHPAPEHVGGMIKERPVAVWRRLQSLEQVRKERHMIGVDLGELGKLLRIVRMVRDRMMRLGHADLRIRPRAALARHLEGHDPRQIGLKGPLQAFAGIRIMVHHRVLRPGAVADPRGEAPLQELAEVDDRARVGCTEIPWFVAGT